MLRSTQTSQGKSFPKCRRRTAASLRASTRPTEAQGQPQPHATDPPKSLSPCTKVSHHSFLATWHWLDTDDHVAITLPSSKPTCHPAIDDMPVTTRILGDSTGEFIPHAAPTAPTWTWASTPLRPHGPSR